MSPSNETGASEQKAVGDALQWVGDTSARVGGTATPVNALEGLAPAALTLETETWPDGAAVEVVAFFAPAGGEATLRRFEPAGAAGNNDAWRLDVPEESLASFEGRFWIRATDAFGQSQWDSLYGAGRDFPLSMRGSIEPTDPTEPTEPTEGWVELDGSDCWSYYGPGRFQEGFSGDAYAKPAGGLGMRWCDIPMPESYELELEYGHFDSGSVDTGAVLRDGRYPLYHNSGIHFGFPDPRAFSHYENPTWVAVNFGYEVQIDDRGHDAEGPNGEPSHSTGIVYERPDQSYERPVYATPGQWRSMRIVVTPTFVRTFVDGALVAFWDRAASDVETATDPFLGDVVIGAPSTPQSPRFIGLQTHTLTVGYRGIRYRAL